MRRAILLICIFTATSADISLITLGTKTAADDGYVYNRPSIPFDLPPKEVIIKPSPGSPGPVIAVTPRTKYNYPTPSTQYKQNEVRNESKQSRIINTDHVIITPRPVQGYDYPAPSTPLAKGYIYEPPLPQLKYPNSIKEQITKVNIQTSSFQEQNTKVNIKTSQLIKIPVSTRPTTTTARPTPKIIQSTYLPPEVITASTTTTTTTRRPTTARLIDFTKDGYTYERPVIPFETSNNKLRADPPKPVPSVYLPPSTTPVTTPRTTTTQKPIASTYLPPEVTRPPTTTTRRPTTARLIDVTKDGYTYERPAIPFETSNNKLRVDPPTPKPVPSVHLPPSTTPVTTSRTTTTQKPIPSTYLPPEVTRPPTTTTRRPTTARLIDVTKDGYTYERPAIPFETSNNKLRVDPPTPKPVPSVHLPPSTTPVTTSRTTTTQKPIASTYLPPEVTRPPTTTTRRPTTARLIDVTKDGYTYERPVIPFETSNNKLRVDPPTPKPVPSVHLPPSTTPVTTSRTTTTQKPIASTYLPPEVTRPPTTTTRRPTTARLIDVTKDGYTYERPAIPFETSNNKLRVDPPTPKPVPSIYLPPSTTPVTTPRTTTTQKPIASTYLPPEVTRPPTTTTRRPTTARLIDVTKDGYTYERPVIPFETSNNKLRADPPKPVPSVYLPPSTTPVTTPRTTTTQKPIPSTYLPPEVTRPPTTTTRRPTTARLIDVTKDGYTYERPVIPFETSNNKLRADPPKPVPSVYLPPSTTPVTTPRTTTTQKPIPSTYLPPEVTRPPTTTTRRPTTARLIDVTKDGYTYERPAIPFETSNNKLRVDPPTPKPVPSIYLPPSTTPVTTPRTTTTQKPIASTYLPPEVTRPPTTTTRRPTTPRLIDVTIDGYTYERPAIPFESSNNKLRVDPPTPIRVPSIYLPPSTTPFTTPRTTTTPKPIASTYLPPEVTRPPTTTTKRPTTARLIDVTKDGYTYERPAIPFETSNNKLRVDPATPKPVPSVYLPPSTTPVTTPRTTTTQKPIQSTYLPPEVSRQTTRRPTTARLVDVTKDGYTYERPAIPFETSNNKLRIDPPTPKPITTPRPVTSVYLPPSTAVTTPRTTTPKQIQSTYLPPEIRGQPPTTTAIRPARTNSITSTQSRGGYKYEKPIVPAEAVATIARLPTSTGQATNTVRGGYKYEKPGISLGSSSNTLKEVSLLKPKPEPLPSTYLPPDLTVKVSTTRPTTVRSVASTYLPPNEKPQQSKVNLNTQKPTIITTIRPVVTSTAKFIPSTYLPPNEKPEQSKTNLKTQILTTQLTTVRTTPKSVPSTYLPPIETQTVRQRATTTRATVKPSPKSVAPTYLPPHENGEQSKTNLKLETPTTRLTTIQTTRKPVPLTYLPPTARPTPKSVASTYLPPNEKGDQSKTNLKTENPTTRLTTVRTTPKSVPSTYLPPSETITVRQQQTTRATVKPSPKSVAPTYLPPKEKAEQSKTNLKLQTTTARATTNQTTPKSVPSTYLPPQEKPTIKVQPTTRSTVKPTQKSLVSTYLPPNEKSEQSRSNLNFQKPTTTTIRTTVKTVPPTYLPPIANDNGYNYPKPAIPFTF